MLEPIVSVKGSNGTFDLYEDKIVAKKIDMDSLISNTNKNARTIYIKDISKINYKKPTFIKYGYIQILFKDQLKKDLTSKEALLDPNSLFIRPMRKQTIVDSEKFYNLLSEKLKNKEELPSDTNENSEKFAIEKIMNITIDRNNNLISRKKSVFSSEIETQKLTDIKDYKVDQQDDSKEKHHRITRAVTGSFLLGPAGAIVGGLTGGKTVKYINNLSVDIIFNDNTVWTVKFITYKTKTDSMVCKGILEKFKKLCNTLEQFIDDNNQSTPTTTSAADEIRKYKSLLDDGIITQDEFDTKKKELLSN